MAMTFRWVGSVCCAGALMLAAVGCNVETSSGEAEAEIESTTQALCDTAYYAGICQRQCINGCTDGNVISACMSACIGGYCAQQQFVPHERCSSVAWWPEPTTLPPPSQQNCESDVLMSCQRKCDLCSAVGSTGRGVCLQNCTVKWCAAGPLAVCHENRRLECQTRCITQSGEARYSCMALCFNELCD